MDREMITLSIQVSDIMSYEIKISRETRAKVFPIMMKRFKTIYNMIQKEEERNTPRVPVREEGSDNVPQKVDIPQKVVRGRPRNPMMNLSVEESRDLIALYKVSSAKNFDDYLQEKFNVAPLKRQNLSHLMWRIKKRMRDIENG